METPALKKEKARGRKLEAALGKSKSRHTRLLQESRDMQKQLSLLSRRLLLSQEEERRRISRELHDEIVQTLVAISMHLSALTVSLPVDVKELKRKIVRTHRLVNKSVNIVHRFARELRPMVLDDLGLIPALKSFAKEFTNRTHIPIHFTAFNRVENLSNTRKTVLYRVAQSALSNVHKHAKATEVRLSIRKLPGLIRLEIHDNGKSFETDRVLFAKRHRQLGLLGSRERMEAVGGRFFVKSTPREGTSVIAEMPAIYEKARERKKAAAKGPLIDRAPTPALSAGTA
jgi:two-component system sensor histidine kinase DegS